MNSMRKQEAANIANLVLGTISTDKVLEAYFTNNNEIIIKEIATNSKDPEAMFRTIEAANYEIENEELLSKSSSYGIIQTNIVDNMAKTDNLEFFETNIINNEQIIGESCPSIERSSSIIEDIKQQNLGMEMSK